MPMTIQFHDKAIRTLVSPPPPVPPLRDIIWTIKKSPEINALAVMGRDILRACVIARYYKAPINGDFLESIDNTIDDQKLSIAAERSGLLERLKVHEVATDIVDRAQILLAYMGAAFMSDCKEFGTNSVHESINDLCSMLLDAEQLTNDDNNSHERMTKIPGVTRMETPGTTRPSSPIKQESTNSVLSSTLAPAEGARFFDDGFTNESISSGRSPPPLSYVSHYQQSYQPYYPPNPSNPPMHPSHLQHMHNQPMHSRFSPYASGPIQTASPVHLAQPQPQSHYHMSPNPSQMQPQMHPQMQPPPPPQGQPQAAFAAQPPLGGMPPGYMTGMQPNPAGFVPAPPAMAPVVPQQSQGYISLINELAMKNRKGITWQQAKTGAQHMPEWTLWLYVDGQLRGQGTATTKQAAKELASKSALANLGWAHS